MTAEQMEFRGDYEPTLAEDGRLRLPQEMIEQLVHYNVYQVWLGRLFHGKGLVLCPESKWQQWRRNSEKEVPQLKERVAKSAFWAGSDLRKWDRKNRLYIPQILAEWSDILAGRELLLLAVDYYFELWDRGHYQEFVDRFHKDW